MNIVQKSYTSNRKSMLAAQRRHLLSAAVLFLTLLLAGCGKTGSASAGHEPASSAALQSFSPDEAEAVPEIPLYPLDTAEELGTVQKLYGMLPGASDGTWYIAAVDGIEYYYGIYSFDEQSESELYGYAVFDDSYCLANGIKVGMTEDEILAAYPNMAVMDFDGNFLQDKIDCLGWNFAAYPRSYLDMDASFDYGGTDYFWSDQFDHLLIAEVDQNSPDVLPLYLALLIKDQSVAAITFYHPTAN